MITKNQSIHVSNLGSKITKAADDIDTLKKIEKRYKNCDDYRIRLDVSIRELKSYKNSMVSELRDIIANC